MGYHSTFEVVYSEVPLEELSKRLHFVSERYGWADAGWDYYQTNDGTERLCGYDSTKWYDWLEDLMQYAMQYPDDYFIVLRHGEESPDMSRVIVRNGTAREQFPHISWPPE